jgi:NmrA-like family
MEEFKVTNAQQQNITPDIMGKVMLTCWKVGMKPDRPMQLIAVKDIGYFGAQAFLHPDQYAGRGISIAGDELTYPEAHAVFKKVFGKDWPLTFDILGKGVLVLMSDIKAMFKWLDENESGANIQELRKIRPELLTFERWLKEESGWAKKN